MGRTMGMIVRLSRSGLAVTLAAVFVALQLVRPGLARAPARTELAAPPAVRDVLRDSCYDSHSSETRLSWFDQGVPADWLAARRAPWGSAGCRRAGTRCCAPRRG